MLFCQLGQAHSLRGICGGLANCEGKLRIWDRGAPHLESGALVQVLVGVVSAEWQIALVYPERTFLPPQVRAFIEAVAGWVSRNLPRTSARPCPSSRACSRRRPRVALRARGVLALGCHWLATIGTTALPPISAVRVYGFTALIYRWLRFDQFEPFALCFLLA